MGYCSQCGKELKARELCDCQKNENYGDETESVTEKKHKNKKIIILMTAIVIVIIAALTFFIIWSRIENSKEVSRGSTNRENAVLENVAENYDAEDIENLEAAEKDFEDLENMLEGLSYIVDLEFDSSIAGFEGIFSNLVKDRYYFFKSTIEEIYDDSEQKADPQNKLYYEYDGKRTYSYFKLNGEEIDWISKNIYNVEPNHNLNEDNFYYDNGYYYITAGDAACGLEHISSVMNYKYFENGRYYITVEHCIALDEIGEKSINYMEVDLKNIGGKKQWTIYKNSEYQFNCDEDYGEIIDYKELKPIDYAYYKNERNNTKAQSSSRLYTDDEVFEAAKQAIKSKQNSQWAVIESYSFGDLEACTYDESSQIYTLYFKWDRYILSENRDEKYDVTAIYQQENDELKLIKIVPQMYSVSSY